MLNLLFSLFVGWPAILVSLGLAMYGLFKNNYRFLAASAFLAVPFSWFLSGFPVVRSPVFLAPVLLFSAAWALRRGSEMLAWFLVIPFFLMILLLVYVLYNGTV